MLTRDDLAEVLAAITVTAPVRSDEVTPSTNATAVALAEAGEPEWTLVSAGHQTEGHGPGRQATEIGHIFGVVGFAGHRRLLLSAGMRL